MSTTTVANLDAFAPAEQKALRLTVTLETGRPTGFDVVAGGSGSDSLLGGDADDTLIGGTGNDFLAGGTGPDDFDFEFGDGTDRITDWQADLDRIVGPDMSTEAVTVEVFARWLHGRLAATLGPLPGAALRVRVWESPSAFGGYGGGLDGRSSSA